MTTDTIIKVIGFILTSALLGSVISSLTKTRLSRKQLIAGATKSALRRVEMYYRIRRRVENNDDKVKIRDSFHDIQEENDYYSSLLSVESAWLGYRYSKFIKAIKRQTEPLIQEAWKQKTYGPSGELKNIKHPQIDKYVSQFAKDSRKLFNPFSRVLMRIKYTLKKWVDTDAYEQ